MFNGLSKEKAEQFLKPFAPALLDFVEAIYADKAGQDDGAPTPARAPALSRAAMSGKRGLQEGAGPRAC